MSENVTVQLVYLGQRMSTKNKPVHAWALASNIDETRTFTVAGRVVGGIYTVEAASESAESIYPSTLTFTREMYEPIYPEWRVRHEATIRRVQVDKAERALVKRSDLDRACEPLEDLASRLRTRDDLAALRANLDRRLVDAFYRGK